MYALARFFGPVLMVVGFTILMFSVQPPSPCYYGPLENGCLGYGLYSNESIVPRSTFKSYNGSDTMVKFDFVYNNFSDASRICFYPGPDSLEENLTASSPPIFSMFNTAMFAISITLVTCGLLLEVVAGVIDYRKFRRAFEYEDIII
jgi:hypothetical protein